MVSKNFLVCTAGILLCLVFGHMARGQKVRTLPATDITATSATLHGKVGESLVYPFPWLFGFDLTSSGSSVSFGLVKAVDAGQSVSEMAAPLSPDTTYWFSAVVDVVSPGCPKDFGDILSFTTLSLSLPRVSTEGVAGVSRTWATLRGRIENDGNDGGNGCQYRFRYEKAGGPYSYTSWGGIVAAGQSFSQIIDGLDSGCAYYFNAQAKNSKGESDWGSEQSFVTSDVGDTCVVVTVKPGSPDVKKIQWTNDPEKLKRPPLNGVASLGTPDSGGLNIRLIRESSHQYTGSLNIAFLANVNITLSARVSVAGASAGEWSVVVSPSSMVAPSGSVTIFVAATNGEFGDLPAITIPVHVELYAPPFASFEHSPKRPVVGENVAFDASMSEGLIKWFTWDWGDGHTETVNAPTTSHIFEKPGTYNVTLTVTDDDGIADSTSKTLEVATPTGCLTIWVWPNVTGPVEIKWPDHDPNGSCGWNTPGGSNGCPFLVWTHPDPDKLKIRLIPAGSNKYAGGVDVAFVANGNIRLRTTISPASYVGGEWSSSVGPGTLDAPGGTVSVSARVTNGEFGGLPEVTIPVHVELYSSPVASFEYSPKEPVAGGKIRFDASKSKGGIEQFRWDWGDGHAKIVNTPTTSHVFEKAGAYTVTLTVVDYRWMMDSTSKTLRVVGKPTVSTQSASDITKNSAQLWGTIEDDGGLACQYRFGYKKTGDPNYTCTSWTGSARTHQSFSESVGGLSPDSTYYFAAQGKNSAGESDWGGEMSFVTLPDWGWGWPCGSGDVSGDGEVTAYDAALAAQYAAGLIKLTDTQINAADVDCDGKVTDHDARLIAEISVGLIVRNWLSEGTD